MTQLMNLVTSSLPYFVSGGNTLFVATRLRAMGKQSSTLILQKKPLPFMEGTTVYSAHRMRRCQPQRRFPQVLNAKDYNAAHTPLRSAADDKRSHKKR